MDRAKFYAALRKDGSDAFGSRLSAKTVAGMEGILDAFVTHGDGHQKTLAYALSTTRGEVGRNMQPVREGSAKTNAGAIRAVQALARRRGPNSAVAKYVQPAGPYGHVYYGRAQMQLTWLENYRSSSDDAGFDLVKYPDKMLDPLTSSRVLIRGLMDGRWNGRGKGIAFYLRPGGEDDLKGARRTVNVTDEWRKFGSYYRVFMKAIDAAGGIPVSTATQPTPEPVLIPPPPDIPKPDDTPSQPPQSGYFFALMQLLGRLFK